MTTGRLDLLFEVGMQFIRFAAVGVIGTLGHYVVLVVLVHLVGSNPVLASAAGAAVGAILNYFLNYRFTFNSKEEHRIALPRFLTVMAVGFNLNLIIMYVGVDILRIHYLIVQVFATGVVLVWNFTGNRLWTFGGDKFLRRKDKRNQLHAALAGPCATEGGKGFGSLAEPAYLIVNADDYGYFACVSRGILAAAQKGVVTATGVLANAPFLEQQLAWLASCPNLDTGVHLNLTSGTPISCLMRDRLHAWSGQFIKKERMCSALLRGLVTVADVRVEWQSQIEHCLAQGLSPRFLNSHEHIHMLPPLFSLIHELAAQYAIEHVRYPLGEMPQRWTAGAVARNLIIHSLGWLSQRRRGATSIPCLGIAESGRLSFDYLLRLVSLVERGRIYEVMCHPGYYEPDEIKDHRLLSYHDWEAELRVLTSEATFALFARHGIRLIGYRHLSTSHGRLSVDSVERHP